ncbi:hypothetical protein M422DRAFT_246920 [Sphaerobolus stellatus SS14]|nr:hypothetical protein M422DRAFT_246920 [Sphaerobolus stellatus SS14]
MHGITHRDQLRTYFQRSGRMLIRSAAVQGKKIKENDSTLQKSYTELSKLQDDVTKQISTLKRTTEKGTTTEPTIKRLRTTEKEYEDAYSALSALECRSSCHIHTPELIEPTSPYISQLSSASSSTSPICWISPNIFKLFSSSSILQFARAPSFQWISNRRYNQLNMPFPITDSLPQFTSAIAATAATSTTS